MNWDSCTRHYESGTTEFFTPLIVIESGMHTTSGTGWQTEKYRGLKAQHFTNKIKLIDIIRQIVQLQFHNDLILNSLIENYSWLMQTAY